ncbi:MAG: CRP-like cAMP-binding protein [Paracoccaceae bacterium]|jgi:CRP-like cAMP-binding protein
MTLQIVVPEVQSKKPLANGKVSPPTAFSQSNSRPDSRPDSQAGSQIDLLSDGNRLVAIANKLATEHRHVAAGAELCAFSGSEKFLFVVIDGWMFRNAILEDGRRQILDFILPGDLIAGRRWNGAEVSQTVDAITDSVVALIPLHAVSALVTEIPSVAITLLEASQSALYASYENLVDTGRRTSIEAVAHFLIRIEKRAAEAIGRTDDGAVVFPLIQEYIGDAIGLTAVHVCRTLRKLKTAGAIEMGRGWLKITDPAALAEFAGISDESAFDTEYAVQKLAS